jgi:AcrR family transcriptional regulator
MSATKSRLSAEERKTTVLECACQIFAKGSYHGATTAEIARTAGVTEPILYRHFSSKRDLYLACLTEAWNECRAMWEEAVASEPDPGLWLTAMGNSYFAAKDKRGNIALLWVQALTEANRRSGASSGATSARSTSSSPMSSAGRRKQAASSRTAIQKPRRGSTSPSASLER